MNTIRRIKRDYWTGEHASYSNKLHCEHDLRECDEHKPRSPHGWMPRDWDRLLTGVPDGHLVEIVVKDLGPAPAAAGKQWQLTEPHTYAPVDTPSAAAAG